LCLSGGGGSFVAFADNTPKIVAGGGGGWRNTYEGVRPQTSDGTISNNGNSGYANNANLNNGGTNGNGGWTTTPWSHGGGGGAGFYGNGDASNDNRGGTALPPMSFVNGGVGGLTPSNYFGPNGEQGGFGGGAGGGWGGAAGGGGYSGGGADYNSGWAGGGGSYNVGVNQDNQGGIRLGHGQVIITSAAPSNTAPLASAQSVSGNEDAVQTITLAGTDAQSCSSIGRISCQCISQGIAVSITSS
jgi:hypothetical protein